MSESAPVQAQPDPDLQENQEAPRLRAVPDPAVEPGASEDSPTAAEMSRLAAWAHATFRPPQVWSERPLSAAEAVAAARNSDVPGKWAAVRRGYGYGAAGVTVAAVFAIWVIQAPARLATAAVLFVICLVTVITAVG